MAGEFDFIDWVKSQQTPTPFVPTPVGDDLAVLKWSASDLLLVGADQVIDGVHFDSAVHTPRQIGKKAMNRNLSDCAAMACLPAAAVVTVALPKGTSIEYAKALYLGLKEAADVFECPIVGGDTSTWQGKLLMSVTIMGKSAGVKPITRDGAKPGDVLYVTGALGGSIAGRHLSFEPRVHLARRLASTGHVTSMIDLSDGLSRDVRHLCARSGVGAHIRADAVPLHHDIQAVVRSGWRAVDHALNDGEDYELLFTASLGAPMGDDVWPIGYMTSDPRIILEGEHGTIDLEPKGWEHTL